MEEATNLGSAIAGLAMLADQYAKERNQLRAENERLWGIIRTALADQVKVCLGLSAELDKQ